MSVIVSHIAFSTLAALVQVSQVQFDTQAATADVRVSWVEFDTRAATPPIIIPPSSIGGPSWITPPNNYPKKEKRDEANIRIARKRADEEILLTIIVNAVTNNLLDG